MEMEEESGTEDPVALMRRHNCPIGPECAAEGGEKGGLEFDELLADEFVDLQELSTLSDGDLCLSRQLATTIGNEDAGLIDEDAKTNTNGPIDDKHLRNCGELSKNGLNEDFNDYSQLKDGGKKTMDNFLPTEAVEQFLMGMDENEKDFDGQYQRMIISADKMIQNGGFVKSKSPSMFAHNDPSTLQSTASMAMTSSSIDQQQPLLPPPPPIVISPADVDHISITLEKNQQCACADCGKLFNSVWYLKQHAVKHSNDRPFKCRFCMKTYKFRSNLYQHKCPERNRLLISGEFNLVGHPYRRRAYNRSADKKHKKEQQQQQQQEQQQIRINTENLLEAEMPMNGTISINTGATSSFIEPSGAGGILSPPHSLDEANAFGMGLLMMGGPIDGNAEFNYTGAGGHLQQNLKENLEQIQQQKLHSSPELIEEYLRRNKHRIFNCRKCKLYFPSNEYFSRHMAYHKELDDFKFICPKCPERFQTEHGLESHHLQHVDQSPHCCLNCTGIFRSALALRRHKDNWPQCHSPTFGLNFPFFPIDQFSFMESDLEEILQSEEDEDRNQPLKQEIFEPLEICGEEMLPKSMPKMFTRKTTRDSGYHGSDSQSPRGSHSPHSNDDGSSSFMEQQQQQNGNGIDLNGGRQQFVASNKSNKSSKNNAKVNKKRGGGGSNGCTKKRAPLYGAECIVRNNNLNGNASSIGGPDQNNNNRQSTN